MKIPLRQKSNILTVLVADNSGAPVTGLDAATMPAMQWIFTSAAGCVVNAFPTLSDLGSAVDAFLAGGVFELGKGRYRVDAPDAIALAVGTVDLAGEDSGKRLFHELIEIDQTLQMILLAAAAGAENGQDGGPTGITITPVTSTVSAGQIVSDSITGYWNAAQTLTLAVVDGNKAPVPLTGKWVRFTAARKNSLNTPVIIHDNETAGGLTLGGTDDATVTIAISAADMATVQELDWALWNMTDGVALGQGVYRIKPISQQGPT